MTEIGSVVEWENDDDKGTQRNFGGWYSQGYMAVYICKNSSYCTKFKY